MVMGGGLVWVCRSLASDRKVRSGFRMNPMLKTEAGAAHAAPAQFKTAGR
jgi:hypothetical protein